jgi:lipoprotein-anchoring transpeptidase ErfK/SrfK
MDGNHSFMCVCFATAALLIAAKNFDPTILKVNVQRFARDESVESNLLVDLSDRQVYVYRNNERQASYIIAIGRDGWETPVGDYKVINMQVDPVWQHPFTQEIVPSGAANNPLGSRWIGFWTDGSSQIGFHGTKQTDLLGQAVSHGCIRMRDQDIQSMYTQVMLETPVLVRP